MIVLDTSKPKKDESGLDTNLIKDVSSDSFNKDINKIITIMVDILYMKASIEKQAQNYNNMTRVNGIGFWFQNGNLNFSSHPKYWPIEKMLNEIGELEIQLYRRKGTMI